MAFVKDAVLDCFKRDVELNFNALEDRVIELEKLLKQYNGGTPVEEVAPEPEVVEEEEEEILPEEDEDEDSEPIAKPIVKQDGKKTK
mgnify:CR=1 FL=1